MTWLLRAFFSANLIFTLFGTAHIANAATAFSGYGNPEQGFCVGDSIKTASSCAVDACRQTGGTETDCAQVRTCRQSGWSMTVTITDHKGYYWDEFHCGYASQQAALRMLPMFCRESRMRMVKDCRLTFLADPEGTPIPIK